MTEPYEYLYIDSRRLASYYEQLQPEPSVTKLPEWKAAIGLTSLSVEASQKTALRSANIYEQIASLLRYLENLNAVARSFDHDDVARDDEYEGIAYVPFVFAQIDAVRVTVVPHSSASGAVQPLNLWLHERDERRAPFDGNLLSVCLMEDFRREDAPVIYAGYSASFYSALLGALRERYPHLANVISADDPAFKRLVAADPSQEVWHILLEPISEIVQRLGGRITGTRRRIEVLCRVREYWSSASLGTHAFAYPIFIRVPFVRASAAL